VVVTEAAQVVIRQGKWSDEISNLSSVGS